MKRFPENLKYTKDHEWAKIEGKNVTVGITDHAQSALGDVVFIELPKVGRELKVGETFGVVESIKAVSDLYSPVAGKVVAVNDALTQEPSKVNQHPHDEAWMIRVETQSPLGDSGIMMSSSEYEKFVAEN